MCYPESLDEATSEDKVTQFSIVSEDYATGICIDSGLHLVRPVARGSKIEESAFAKPSRYIVEISE